LKALALFSGGLDSSLAVKVIKEQGIEVIGLNFVSYFFGGENERSEKAAKELGIQLEYIDFKERHRLMMLNPVCGYGKNMNPCIDCHGLMIKIAYENLEKYGANFIITGEVLGQRPMSQNRIALKRVDKLSGTTGYVVRPLSGQLMEETIPEKMGWISREKLLNFNGRNRTPQIELAKKYNLVHYPSPGGGCLLTEPNYSKRLKIIKDDNNFHKDYLFYLAKNTRMYKLNTGKYIFVGRDEESNQELSKYKEYGSIYITTHKVPGPYIIGIGDFEENDITFAKELFSRYSKIKGECEIEMNYNGEVIKIGIIDKNKLENMMKELQIVN